VIVVTPVEIPVTTPDPAPTVATDVLLLVHDTPPEVASLSEVVPPTQILVLPVIASGTAITVTVLEALHPAAVV
jgi:hypothetical protein